MKKYTEEDLAILYLFKKRNATKNNSIRSVVFISDINKMLNNEKVRIEKAIKFAEENGFIDASENSLFIWPTKSAEEIIYWNNPEGEIQNMDIKEKKAARYKFLNELYTEVAGSKSTLVNAKELGEKLGYNSATSRDITSYLSDEGLLEIAALGGIIRITHNGILEIENALSHPEQETTYFPAVNYIQNTVNIHGNNSAPLQVGNSNSTQSTTTNINKLEEIKKWINNLEEVIQEEQLNNQELNDEIETIKSLLSTRNPKMQFMHASLDTIKTILLGIVSNAAFQGLLAGLPLL